ncbi:MAG: hypothetical protein DIU79_03510 [Actinobacteria bacterium]|nr:MAG: hypothetical protein DIU79_03510 [Actinomycetota bacterium]HLT09248.1 hypothetical protein [Micromonosporaceae bacterium]
MLRSDESEHRPQQRRRFGVLTPAAEIATILSAIPVVVGLVVAGLALLQPDDTPDSGQDVGAPAATSSVAQPAPTPALTFLNRLEPERGRHYLAALPRSLDAAQYPNPVVITCPTNQSDDPSHPVTWPLSGRFLRFTATVTSYYDPPALSVVEVTAAVGIARRDGHIATADVGRQRVSEHDTAVLDVSVEGARQLTLRVVCEKPGGLVILTDARLTAAT